MHSTRPYTQHAKVAGILRKHLSVAVQSAIASPYSRIYAATMTALIKQTVDKAVHQAEKVTTAVWCSRNAQAVQRDLLCTVL